MKRNFKLSVKYSIVIVSLGALLIGTLCSCGKTEESNQITKSKVENEIVHEDVESSENTQKPVHEQTNEAAQTTEETTEDTNMLEDTPNE